MAEIPSNDVAGRGDVEQNSEPFAESPRGNSGRCRKSERKNEATQRSKTKIRKHEIENGAVMISQIRFPGAEAGAGPENPTRRHDFEARMRRRTRSAVMISAEAAATRAAVMIRFGAESTRPAVMISTPRARKLGRRSHNAARRSRTTLWQCPLRGWNVCLRQ